MMFLVLGCVSTTKSQQPEGTGAREQRLARLALIQCNLMCARMGRCLRVGGEKNHLVIENSCRRQLCAKHGEDPQTMTRYRRHVEALCNKLAK